MVNSPLLLDLRGRRALVTGASGELGRTIAKVLAMCGADVAVHYFNSKEKAQTVCDTIRSFGRQSEIFQADISNMNAVVSMHQSICEKMGNVDVLVINAVVQYPWKTLLDQDPKDYFSQFESTVMQSIYLSKVFLPSMIKQGFGRIIGMNTECTMQCLPTQSAYVAGKRGMDGVFRVLAKEVGEHQITVNQVAPGWTLSEKDRYQTQSEGAEYAKGVPLKRRGTDDEVAQVVAFLASPLANFITGAYIPVNGGNVMPTV